MSELTLYDARAEAEQRLALERAEARGALAARQMRALEENPYPVDTEEGAEYDPEAIRDIKLHDAWERGWTAVTRAKLEAALPRRAAP